MMEEMKEIQVVQYKVWRTRWERPETEERDELGQLIKSYGQPEAKWSWIFIRETSMKLQVSL